MRQFMPYVYLFCASISYIELSFAELTETEKLLAEMATVQGNAHLMKAAVEAGKERALLCGNCHGKNGNSVRDYIPNLASQNAAYLFNQFELFAKGERKDYVMGRLAKNLNRQDRVNIALYFSQMPVDTRSQPVLTSAQGEKIYKSLCFTCHQKNGYGDGRYPRIAGQPYEYLVKTLNGFAGDNDRRLTSSMATIVANMDKQQLQNVAAFVANMP
jgi:cytochrome c553